MSGKETRKGYCKACLKEQKVTRRNLLNMQVLFGFVLALCYSVGLKTVPGLDRKDCCPFVVRCAFTSEFLNVTLNHRGCRTVLY